MSIEIKKEIQLEIAHVLFIDVVQYSELLIDAQRAMLATLNEIVRHTDEFRRAESEGRLLRIPSGDGMALVFYHSPEAPVECALEIARALKKHPEIPLRMGVHSGPISGVVDVNECANVAGAGINIARRVMDCGDAGHILLSKHVAEDLEQYRHWQPHLHDLGECEVKHGARVHVVNLYTEELGNPHLPNRFKHASEHKALALAQKRAVAKWTLVCVLVLVLAAAVIFLSSRSLRSHLRFGQTNSQTSALAAIPDKSIAVLPFENLSDEKENAYFADGVQDEILTDLAKIADLKVISRTSVMQYRDRSARHLRDIATQLGVAHVLEGTVQRAGHKVRVSAQLIDARSDAHSWANSYDRDLADVFAIQSEIAKTIADQLQAKLSPTEKAAIEKVPTTDLNAHDLYLRAQALYADTSDQIKAREKLPQAARLLDEAVSRDPHFILAWCLIARVHGDTYWQGFDHTSGRLDLARVALQSAMRLEPDGGDVHLALASYYYHGFRDYERARNELAIARRTLPNSTEVFEYTGYIDRRQGRWEEATRNLQRALELDPRNFGIVQQLALAYEVQHRYAEQAQMCERALSIVPDDPYTLMTRAQIAFQERADITPFQTTLATLLAKDPKLAPDVDDPDHALCERTPEAVARALKNYPRDGVGINGVNYPLSYWEGVVARYQHDEVKAHAAFTAARMEVEKILEKQPDFAAALSFLGMIDAGLGRKEEALREGRRACELLPISKDSIDGAAFAVNLALIYAWTGEKDLAIEQIAAIERVPNYLSYGVLKLHPYWDPLRGDPRFEKIVADLAPK